MAKSKVVLRVVVVTWEDPTTHTGWTKKADGKLPLLITSVGFLVSQDNKYIRIGMDWSGTDWNGIGVIPKGCIRTIRMLPARV